MATVFEKILGVMHLGDEDEYDDEYDEEYDDDEEEAAPKRSLFSKNKDDADDDGGRTSKITSISRGKRITTGGGMKVRVIKPASFEDTREIAESLLADRTVVLNMEGIDLALAQRIIDFISGATYAIDGNLQKVSNYIFLVTPHAVDISGDLQGIIDAFDFSGIQTGF